MEENKINWQEHSSKEKKKIQWPLIGGWIKHIAKMIMCLVFVAIAFFYLVLPQIKANYYYASTRCLVSASQMQPLSNKINDSGLQPKFLLIYEVNNKVYTNWAYDILNNIITNPAASDAIIKEITVGKYYVCWYDKNDPHRVILKRGWDHISLVFFFMTIVVLLTSITSFARWFRTRKQTTT